MKSIRVLAFIEATSLTGPAKNLLQAVKLLRQGPGGEPLVDFSIATFDRGGNTKIFAEAVRRAGIPLSLIVERGRFDGRIFRQLFDLIREKKPDLIQTHAVKSHFLIRLARLYRKVPWMALHHGYTWPDWRMQLYNRLDRWSLPTADLVLTVSDVFRRDLIQKGVARDRIEVLHNSIEPDWAQASSAPEATAALRAELGLEPDQKVILNVGRLSDEKDQATLLRVLHRMRRELASTTMKPHLIIVGDGPRRKDLERMRAALGMEKAVTFVGQVASAGPYYGIADLCVMSSLSEGSPNALLEAMVTRVPVVATAVGGIVEIVKDEESALLVQPKDEQGMANAMTRILTQPQLAERLATRAYQHVTTHHVPEVYKERLVNCYEKAVFHSRTA